MTTERYQEPTRKLAVTPLADGHKAEAAWVLKAIENFGSDFKISALYGTAPRNSLGWDYRA